MNLGKNELKGGRKHLSFFSVVSSVMLVDCDVGHVAGELLLGIMVTVNK